MFASFLPWWPRTLWALLAMCAMSSPPPPAWSASPPERSERVMGQPVAMVAVPGGTFVMGSPRSEPLRDSDESPQHKVTVRPFWLARTEVTQALWTAVMQGNPSHFQGCGPECPVDSVSWDDAQAFIAKLNAQTGKRWRLPTEAEWEYAARAGCGLAFQVGQACRSTLPAGAATWNGQATRPVGGLPGNRWGLHDMQGSVAEWVQDCWARYDGAVREAKAVEFTRCKGRVLRGGSWFNDARWLRAAARNYFEPTFRHDTIGLRLARDLD